MTETSASADDFAITRVFDAPRDLVWRAWTEPDRLVAWFGPKGAPPARVLRYEFRVGGILLSAMGGPDGAVLCGKFLYREITPISRLVWVHSFADADGVNTRHPFVPDWPLELLTTVSFVDLGERTEVTLRWTPLNAGAAERAAFEAGKEQTHGGWSGSFEALAEFLAGG